MQRKTDQRKTHQRDAIRTALERVDRPMSPQEVLDSAQRQVAGLGIATVYRELKRLSGSGWLTRVELPGESTRYERADKAHHHHFQCRGCGRVYELEECNDDLINLSPPGFVLEDHEVVLYGRCRTCVE